MIYDSKRNTYHIMSNRAICSSAKISKMIRSTRERIQSKDMNILNGRVALTAIDIHPILLAIPRLLEKNR